MALYRVKPQYRKRGGVLSYYGKITNLSSRAADAAATPVGDYALFGGGMGLNNICRKTVDTYNKSLTRSSAPDLDIARSKLAGASVGNYALFAGGRDTQSNISNLVDVYNTNLSKSTSLYLSFNNYDLASASTKDYAVFLGGSYTYTARAVNAYNSSLIRSILADLSCDSQDWMGCTTVGNYILYGGYYYNNNASGRIVDVYDNSLTKRSSIELSIGRMRLSATSVGNYALFAGGDYTGSSLTDVVDTYNKSLTRSSASPLNAPTIYLKGCSLKNYALFRGGKSGSYQFDTAALDAYDTSLTKTYMYEGSAAWRMAATSIGDYVLFGGSGVDGNNCKFDVYAYKIA